MSPVAASYLIIDARPQSIQQIHLHPTMAPNPFKRARLNPGSRRDVIPLPDEDRTLPVREMEPPSLVRVGGAQTILQRPIVRTTIEASPSAWSNLQLWEPLDDQNYALDPADGGWYDESLEGEVMDPPRPPQISTKRIYKRSKVSVSQIQHTLCSYIY